MKTLDVRGKLCPEPLIITKRAIKGADKDELFEVILDNDIATCNLEALLQEMGITFRREDNGNTSTLLFGLNGVLPNSTESSNEELCNIPTPKTGGYVTVIVSEGMGSTDELGTILMRGFINSLIEQDVLPQTIILYNSGVKVAIKGSDTANSLNELSDAGVDIILCGVCVDYFELREQIAVGRISNMLEITSTTRKASHIIYP